MGSLAGTSPVPSQLGQREPSSHLPRPWQVGHFLSFSTDMRSV